MIAGSCHCGTVKYETHGRVPMFAYCPGPDCRKYTGPAFSSVLVAESQGFKIASGADPLAEYRSSPGKHRFFCRTCGCRIYLRAEHRPGMIFVRAGALDDAPQMKPQRRFWTSAKAPWHEIADSLPQYPEGLPEKRKDRPATPPDAAPAADGRPTRQDARVTRVMPP